MKEEVRARFSVATALKDQGDLETARELLLELADLDQQSVAILAVLGDVYWDLGRLTEAVTVFRRAIDLAPALEAVSLGLFHCLWELGRQGEALDEVKRFTRISDSADYREIIKEINDKAGRS